VETQAVLIISYMQLIRARHPFNIARFYLESLTSEAFMYI